MYETKKRQSTYLKAISPHRGKFGVAKTRVIDYSKY